MKATKTLFTMILVSISLSACHGGTPKSTPNAAPSIKDINVQTQSSVPSVVLTNNTLSYNLTIANEASSKLASTNLTAEPTTTADTLILNKITPPTGFSVRSDSGCKVGTEIAPGSSCLLSLSAKYSSATSIDSEVSIDTNAGTLTQPVKFQAVSHVTSSMPSHVVLSGDLDIIPGNTATVTVTNKSSTNINTPRLVLPSFLSKIATNQHIQLDGDLAPGKSTTFSFSIPVTTTFTASQVNDINDSSSNLIQLASANTLPKTVSARAISEMSANSIGFSAPGTEDITVNNNAKFNMQVSEVSLQAADGISIATDSCANKTITVGGHCTISVKASKEAHQNSLVTINYTPEGSRKTLQLKPSISTEATTISVAGIGNFNQGTDKTVTLTNNGGFIWRNPNVSLQTNSGSSLNPSSNKLSTSGCSNNVEPGDSCTVTISSDSTTTAGAYDLQVSGDNSNTLTETFTVLEPTATLSVGVDDSWANRGLAVQRILVTNAGESGSLSKALTIELKDAPSNTISIETSSSLANRCISGTTTLAHGAQCFIYLRASNKASVGTTATPELDISAGTDTKVVQLTYQQELYAGVTYYNETTDTDSADILRYNGESWSNMTGSDEHHYFPDGIFYFMKVSPVTGDLYAGGDLVNEEGNNYLATYNGVWHSAGDGPDEHKFDGSLRSITFDNDGIIFAHGRIDNGSDYYVAKLEEGSWSSIGTGPSSTPFDRYTESSALSTGQNLLYVGGTFSNDDHGYVAEYDRDSETWRALAPTDATQTMFRYMLPLPSSQSFLTIGSEAYSETVPNSVRNLYQYSDGTWTSFGHPTCASCKTIAMWRPQRTEDGSVYVTGYKYATEPSFILEDYIAMYKDGTWHMLGTYSSGDISAVVAHNSDELYRFDTDGDTDLVSALSYNDGDWVNLPALPGSPNEDNVGAAIAPTLSVNSIS